jgi:predicted metal-dependent hydrolase
VSEKKQTPSDLVIRPRDLAFGRGTANSRWWMGGDPVATAYFNTLSAAFPQGERFFIESVRNCKSTASPELLNQIAAFTSQEFVHAREHVLFNKQAADAGYDQTRIEAFVKRELDFAKTRGPVEQLAVTISLEHFTAILGHVGLSDPRLLEGMSPENQRLWRWHAMEEIEHKGVAFDTYLAATKNWVPLFRWAMRSGVMVVSTVLFFAQLFVGIREHFRQDNINTSRTWLRLFHYLLVEPGGWRQVMLDYFTFYRPGFHPWQRDDRALLADMETILAAQYAPA